MDTASIGSRSDLVPDETSVSHLRLGSSNSPVPVIKENRKRLRSFSHFNESNQQRAEQLSTTLRATATNILEGMPPSVSYASIFKSVELLCVHKHSEQVRLADFLLQAIDHQLEMSELSKSWHKPLTMEASKSSHHQAERFVQEYQSWVERLKLLEQLFLFVDRTYLLPHPKKKSLYEYGVNQFANLTIYDGSDGKHILAPFQSLAKEMHYECRRSLGQCTDPLAGPNEFQSLHAFFTTLHQLDYKGSIFSEPGLTHIIGVNYKQLKHTWLDLGEQYLSIVLDALSQESLFLTSCGIAEHIVISVLKSLKWSLIFLDFEHTLELSLPSLLKHNQFDKLKAIWKLCEMAMIEAAFDACRSFTFIWGRVMQNQTQKLIEESKENPLTLISNIHELFTRMSKIVEECFNDNQVLFETRSAQGKALGSHTCCSYVIIQLSKHCDSFFKKYRKLKDKHSYIAFEMEVLTIFKLLPSKLDFIEVFERDLSRRMLLGKSFDAPVEKQLVETLLAVVGEGDETCNLRAMFRDIDNSKSLYGLEKIHCLPEVEFNALILEKKFWPDIPNLIPEIAIPKQLSAALGEFTRSYNERSEKHKFHKLDWSNYLLHQIVVSIPFACGHRDLSMNVLQASVLLQFEEVDRLHYDQLLERTKMDMRQLKRVLSSLSGEKYPILTLFESEVQFNYNAQLKGNVIRIPMVREKEVELGNALSKTIHKSMDSNVRATIVRMMKHERQMLYPEILNKTLEITGSPPVSMIKEHIEYLLSNEYLKRENDGITLTYIP